MFIFLDESGDLGFNFANKTPSHYFAITLLICHDKGAVDSFHSAIKKTLKNKINHKKKKKVYNEIKGTRTFQHTKEYFYKHIHSNNNWELCSIVLNKTKLVKELKEELQIKNLYNFLARKILEKVTFSATLSRVELIVDKCQNNKEIKIFNDYLSNHLSSYLPLETKLTIDHIHSFNNTGLQSVDLFSWGIYRKYENEDLDWYRVFCGRIVAEEQI